MMKNRETQTTEVETMTTRIDLYDAKGSCQLCSTSTVQRRVDTTEFANHARRHRDAGDPVELGYSAGVRIANQAPDSFKIVTTTRPEGD